MLLMLQYLCVCVCRIIHVGIMQMNNVLLLSSPESFIPHTYTHEKGSSIWLCHQKAAAAAAVELCAVFGLKNLRELIILFDAFCVAGNVLSLLVCLRVCVYMCVCVFA